MRTSENLDMGLFKRFFIVLALISFSAAYGQIFIGVAHNQTTDVKALTVIMFEVKDDVSTGSIYFGCGLYGAGEFTYALEGTFEEGVASFECKGIEYRLKFKNGNIEGAYKAPAEKQNGTLKLIQYDRSSLYLRDLFSATLSESESNEKAKVLEDLLSKFCAVPEGGYVELKPKFVHMSAFEHTFYGDELVMRKYLGFLICDSPRGQIVLGFSREHDFRKNEFSEPRFEFFGIPERSFKISSIARERDEKFDKIIDDIIINQR